MFPHRQAVVVLRFNCQLTGRRTRWARLHEPHPNRRRRGSLAEVRGTGSIRVLPLFTEPSRRANMPPYSRPPMNPHADALSDSSLDLLQSAVRKTLAAAGVVLALAPAA